MILYNKTNQVQELKVYDRDTKRPYSIYIGSLSSIEIPISLATPGLDKLVNAGVFQVLGTPVPPLVDTPAVVEDTEEFDVLEDPIDTEESTSVDEPVASKESNTEESNTEVTKFICTICGGEFASARGLTNHMNKAHKN